MIKEGYGVIVRGWAFYLTVIRKPAGDGQDNQRGAQSAPEVTFVLGSAAVTEPRGKASPLWPWGRIPQQVQELKPVFVIEVPWVATDRRVNRVRCSSDKSPWFRDAVCSPATRFLRTQVRVWFT